MDLGKVVGSKIHNVTGAPEASLGLVEDWALDVDSGSVYEKTAEGWQLRGSFKGEKGAPGQDGAPGAQGPKGDRGEPGQDGVDGKTPALSINDEGHLIAAYPD
jgi:hypothetical protein